jgi:hypothetical protein
MGDQLGKSEGASSHIIVGLADPVTMEFVISPKSGQRCVREALFAWGSTAPKADTDHAKPGLVCCAQTESDMLRGKRNLIYHLPGRRKAPGGSHFESRLRGIFVLFRATRRPAFDIGTIPIPSATII